MLAIALLETCIIALTALGFALIYNTARFFHFAHGGIYAWGAYSAFFLTEHASLPLIIAYPLAVLFASLLGVLLEVIVYRPMRNRDAGSLVLMIASLGLFVILQNLISMLFGDAPRTLRIGTSEVGMGLLGGHLTLLQVGIICTSLFLIGAVATALKWSSWGRALRAVADDPELARVYGVDTDRVILWTFAIGSGLAALAAILISHDLNMSPRMGLHAVIIATVALIIGGVGSIFGVLLGAAFLGFIQSLATWYIGIEWQDASALIILLFFLVLKPYGFFGESSRGTIY